MAILVGRIARKSCAQLEAPSQDMAQKRENSNYGNRRGLWQWSQYTWRVWLEEIIYKKMNTELEVVEILSQILHATI